MFVPGLQANFIFGTDLGSRKEEVGFREASRAGKIGVVQLIQDHPGAQASQIRVDISGVEPGTQLTVSFLGKPVFIRHRTDAEIAQARSEDVLSLPDTVARNPNISGDDLAIDANRAVAGNENFLVMIGVCTHLGCTVNRVETGFQCPCHGSQYDSDGIVVGGPAPKTLPWLEIKNVPGGQIEIDTGTALPENSFFAVV